MPIVGKLKPIWGLIPLNKHQEFHSKNCRILEMKSKNRIMRTFKMKNQE